MIQEAVQEKTEEVTVQEEKIPEIELIPEVEIERIEDIKEEISEKIMEETKEQIIEEPIKEDVEMSNVVEQE